MENEQLETMYLGDIEHRKSYSLGSKALDILAQVANTDTQKVILDNLGGITCVSKNIEGEITFYVLQGPGAFSIRYRTINGNLVKKIYTPPADVNYEHTLDVMDGCYGTYTINGEEKTDIYFKDRGVDDSCYTPSDIKEDEIVFYGKRVSDDGTEYRHKTFVMKSFEYILTNQAEIMKSFDLEGAKTFLLSKY